MRPTVTSVDSELPELWAAYKKTTVARTSATS